MDGTDLRHRPEYSQSSPLSIHAMTVAYDRKPVLWDVDFDATPGRLVAIVGPNGAGKSTLIKGCLDLVPRASGVVEFWGRALAAVRERIAYVPQRESVEWDFPVSALDVACMGRYGHVGWCRRVGRGHREAARACLHQVGLEGLEDRQISQLSGGQQQRVAVARALVGEPSLLLADEPTGNLDSATGQSILNLLDELHAEGLTIIMVTHDEGVADRCDRVLRLHDGNVASDELMRQVQTTNPESR